MVQDAESHAEEDQKKKERIEVHNQLDSLVYSTEKSMVDHKDQIDSETASKIEAAVETAKKALEGDDTESMKAATEELTQVSHKLAEAMYAQAAQQQSDDAEGPDKDDDPTGGGTGADTKKENDNVVDADFEEVK